MTKTMRLSELKKEVFGTSDTVKRSKHMKQAIDNCPYLTVSGVNVTITDYELAVDDLLTSFGQDALTGKTRRNKSAIAEVWKYRAERLEAQISKLRGSL